MISGNFCDIATLAPGLLMHGSVVWGGGGGGGSVLSPRLIKKNTHTTSTLLV